MVILYVRASKDDEVDSIRKSINDFLSKHGETLSNDILGITIISVNARDYKKNIWCRINFTSFWISIISINLKIKR